MSNLRSTYYLSFSSYDDDENAPGPVRLSLNPAEVGELQWALRQAAQAGIFFNGSIELYDAHFVHDVRHEGFWQRGKRLWKKVRLPDSEQARAEREKGWRKRWLEKPPTTWFHGEGEGDSGE